MRMRGVLMNHLIDYVPILLILHANKINNVIGMTEQHILRGLHPDAIQFVIIDEEIQSLVKIIRLDVNQISAITVLQFYIALIFISLEIVKVSYQKKIVI